MELRESQNQLSAISLQLSAETESRYLSENANTFESCKFWLRAEG